MLSDEWLFKSHTMSSSFPQGHIIQVWHTEPRGNSAMDWEAKEEGTKEVTLLYTFRGLGDPLTLNQVTWSSALSFQYTNFILNKLAWIIQQNIAGSKYTLLRLSFGKWTKKNKKIWNDFEAIYWSQRKSSAKFRSAQCQHSPTLFYLWISGDNTQFNYLQHFLEPQLHKESYWCA